MQKTYRHKVIFRFNGELRESQLNSFVRRYSNCKSTRHVVSIRKWKVRRLDNSTCRCYFGANPASFAVKIQIFKTLLYWCRKTRQKTTKFNSIRNMWIIFTMLGLMLLHHKQQSLITLNILYLRVVLQVTPVCVLLRFASSIPSTSGNSNKFFNEWTAAGKFFETLGSYLAQLLITSISVSDFLLVKRGSLKHLLIDSPKDAVGLGFPTSLLDPELLSGKGFHTST